MQHSDTLSKFATAFAKAQTEFKNPEKNKTVKVKTRSGSEYSYKYADLAPILEDIRPILNKNEISIMQGGSKVIETLLMHSSGEWVLFETDMDVFESGGNMNNVQEFGATMTYGRRYAVSASLGLAADEDNDAGKVESQKPSQPAKTVSKPTSDVTAHCSIHDTVMTERYSTKKSKYYFAHESESGLCFGKPSDNPKTVKAVEEVNNLPASEDDYMEALTKG